MFGPLAKQYKETNLPWRANFFFSLLFLTVVSPGGLSPSYTLVHRDPVDNSCQVINSENGSAPLRLSTLLTDCGLVYVLVY